MVKFIAELIARWVASVIHGGSTRGVFIGAVIGCAAAVAGAYALAQQEPLEPFVVAIWIGLPFLLTTAGAMIRARAIMPSKAPDARQGIRVTNYDAAAGKLLLALLLTAMTTFVIWTSRQPSSEPEQFAGEMYVYIGVAAAMMLVAWLVALRDVWFVDLGQWITIRRLLASRRYHARNVTVWGFEIAGGEVVQTAMTGQAALCLQFDDGTIERIGVDGRVTPSIIECLAAFVPASPSRA